MTSEFKHRDAGPVSQTDAASTAARQLCEIYSDMAPSEALARALVAERTSDREMGQFWALVYLNYARG